MNIYFFYLILLFSIKKTEYSNYPGTRNFYKYLPHSYFDISKDTYPSVRYNEIRLYKMRSIVG